METTTATLLATPGKPVAGPALLQPLRLRDFRLIVTGESISLLGDQFHFIALAVLALQLTGSGLALGTVLMLGQVSLGFSVAGAIVVAAAIAGLFAGVPSQMTDEGEA